jgi:steroid delta-isomerase-like uncharacterized protein
MRRGAQITRRRGVGRGLYPMLAVAAVAAARIVRQRRAQESDWKRERRGSMAQRNKDVSRRLIEEVFNQGKLELLDELAAQDSVGHDAAMPEPTTGPEGMKRLIGNYRTAFPDIRFTIEDQVAEGDRVATRWTARGTHEGDLWGISPTGRQSTVTGITIDRIEGGKIAEAWTNWDALGLMQQLGVIRAQARA